MKNKKFDTVQTIRSIRDINYEKTKEMTRLELLEWYKKRGKAAKNQFLKNSRNSEGVESMQLSDHLIFRDLKKFAHLKYFILHDNLMYQL